LAPELLGVLFERLQLGIAIWHLQDVEDDEDQVRTLVRGILRRHNYRVLDAHTPAEAIGIARYMKRRSTCC
jgi:ActR/RegA family two-component response regulator